MNRSFQDIALARGAIYPVRVSRGCNWGDLFKHQHSQGQEHELTFTLKKEGFPQDWRLFKAKVSLMGTDNNGNDHVYLVIDNPWFGSPLIFEEGGDREIEIALLDYNLKTRQGIAFFQFPMNENVVALGDFLDWMDNWRKTDGEEWEILRQAVTDKVIPDRETIDRCALGLGLNPLILLIAFQTGNGVIPVLLGKEK